MSITLSDLQDSSQQAPEGANLDSPKGQFLRVAGLLPGMVAAHRSAVARALASGQPPALAVAVQYLLDLHLPRDQVCNALHHRLSMSRSAGHGADAMWTPMCGDFHFSARAMLPLQMEDALKALDPVLCRKAAPILWDAASWDATSAPFCSWWDSMPPHLRSLASAEHLLQATPLTLQPITAVVAASHSLVAVVLDDLKAVCQREDFVEVRAAFVRCPPANLPVQLQALLHAPVTCVVRAHVVVLTG